ncbi:hypothetical protein D1F64_11790 [Breoghania sp. L-A4]|nr:hypothetical protein D1F64_11790 [Breoghania sp. L-A4]
MARHSTVFRRESQDVRENRCLPGENSVHGSDAVETAAREIGYWFSETEIVG